MMKFEIWNRRTMGALLSVVLAATLAACGGGGNGGTPVVGPGSGASGPSGAASGVAADLVVVLNKSTMSNSGTDSITATVTSIDDNRVAVANVPVTFTANAGAVVSPAGNGTNASGTLTASVTQGADNTPRSVTLTVKSGSVTKDVTFNVVQNSSPTNPQANDLSLTLSATNIDNSGSRTVTATATAVDQNRNALAGIPVQLSVSDNSAFITGVPVPSQTNVTGQVGGTISIGQDKTNRTVTVTATSGTLVRTAAFEITGAQFSQASPVPSVVNAGAAGTVQYTLTDVNGNPMAGVPISVSGSGITTRSGTTNLNGGYTFNYTAPNTPGSNLTINAAAGGTTSAVAVTIPGGSTTVPAAATPVSKTLNLSANVVSVNNDRTSNQVAINAFFRDAANAPIPYVRVLFGVTGDNGTGKIGSSTNTVLSDTSGAASTTYAPGAVSSPTNGVTIQACWKTTDFAPTDTTANCAAAGGTLMTTQLTIVSNPVSITIGTDNSIGNGASTLTHTKKFVVLVVDSAGNPKSDVQITPSVDLGGYGKGLWNRNISTQKWERSPDSGSLGLLTAVCVNEDLNRNGVIDTGEDINSNLQLDPRKSDVSITLVGATKTDANGVAVLQLEYPKNVASWVKYKITVTAAGVLSPPGYYPLGVPVALPSQAAPANVFDYLYTYEWLPVAAADVAAEAPPSWAISPYGRATVCTDSR